MQLKRVLVSLLVVVLMLSSAVVISAEETAATTFDLTVGTEPAVSEDGVLAAKPGDKIDVSITITSNPGVAMLQFAVAYNPEVLEPVKGTDGKVAIESGIFTFKDSVRDFNGIREEAGKIVFTSDLNNSKDITATGELAKLSFTVKEGAHGTGDLAIVSETAYNAAYEKITITKNAVDVQVHKLGEPEVTAPTCTEGGFTVVKCSECDYVKTYDEVEATGHTEEAYGIDGIKCSVCGEILKETSTETDPPETTESETQTVTETETEVETESETTPVEEEGSLVWLWIVIAVVVVVGAAAAVYFFVIKKKK